MDAFEINFSCPHGMPERKMGMAMGQDCELLRCAHPRGSAATRGAGCHFQGAGGWCRVFKVHRVSQELGFKVSHCREHLVYTEVGCPYIRVTLYFQGVLKFLGLGLGLGLG